MDGVTGCVPDFYLRCFKSDFDAVKTKVGLLIEKIKKTTSKMKITPQMKTTLKMKTTPKMKTSSKTKTTSKMKMTPKMKTFDRRHPLTEDDL